MHERREKQSLILHQRIADRIHGNPEAVLGKAMDNLRRWQQGSEGILSVSHQEWLEILTQRTPSEIAAFIVSDHPDAVRLRQSSPFAGVLGPREVWAIKRGHEAA